MRHLTRIAVLGLVVLGLLSALAGAVAQDEDEPIVVVEVGDPIDQRVLDYIVDALATPDVHAFILKIDSPGVSSGDLTPVLQAVASANAPVVSWIGPNPAVAFGGAAWLANHADVRSAAPGAQIGYLDPAVVRSGEASPSARPGDDTVAFRAVADSLADATQTVDLETPTLLGFVDQLDPALGQLVISLDGVTVDRGDRQFTLSTAMTEEIDGEEFLVASRRVTFLKTGLFDRFLRLGARPETAFLFLVIALAFAVFEFYAAGSGLMAGVAALSLFPAGYGLATLPMWWPSLGLVLGGIGVLVWGFVQNRVDWRAALGSLSLVLGGLLFTQTRPMYPPAPWLVIVASATVVVFIWYTLTTVVRGRFATPTVGRESMLGRRAVVVDELEPIGVVIVDGVRWRAAVDRGVVVQPGAAVEIVGITGLLLDVEPIGGS